MQLKLSLFEFKFHHKIVCFSKRTCWPEVSIYIDSLSAFTICSERAVLPFPVRREASAKNRWKPVPNDVGEGRARHTGFSHER
jgi:hypothetical protein